MDIFTGYHNVGFYAEKGLDKSEYIMQPISLLCIKSNNNPYLCFNIVYAWKEIGIILWMWNSKRIAYIKFKIAIQKVNVSFQKKR